MTLSPDFNFHLREIFTSLFHVDEKERAETLFESELVTRYSEDHRFYHTLQHIKDCIFSVQALPEVAFNVEAVTMAVFFHDIIYDSKSKVNELNSANLMSDLLSVFSFDESFIKIVYNLILATQHPSKTTDPDSLILLDIDLLILASGEDTFMDYNKSIRKEFSWVPDDIFEIERKKFLKSMLDEDEIFKTRYFSHLNQTAKNNLWSVTK